jgi:hypothetical protein
MSPYIGNELVDGAVIGVMLVFLKKKYQIAIAIPI